MEGVEDIPGSALSAGIRWEWETFPEYLDALDRLPKLLDIAQAPHGAVRGYVMGERGAKNERRRPTSRPWPASCGKASRRAPGSRRAARSRTWRSTAKPPRHLRRRGRALRHRSGARRARPRRVRACLAGRPGEDLAAPDREMAWMRKLGGDRATGHLCADAERSRPGRGAACSICPRKPRPKRGGAAGRGPSVTLLLGLQTFHPFAHCPSWAAVSGETPAAKAVRMQDPELRRRLLAEVDARSNRCGSSSIRTAHSR